MIGFLIASFVGVTLIRIGIGRGYSKLIKNIEEVPKNVFKGIVPSPERHEPAGKITTSLQAIETLSFIVAIMGLSYLSAYLFGFSLQSALVSMGGIFAKISKIVMGSLWIISLVFGIIWGYALGKAGSGYLIDPGLTRRIIGVIVDYMVVIALCALSLPVLYPILPELLIFSAIVFSVVISTTLYIMPRVFPDFRFERMMQFFGSATGQANTGTALLRIMDHKLETPVLADYALGVAPCVIPFIPAIMMGTAAQIGIFQNTYILLAPILIYMAILIALSLFMLRRYWGPLPERFKSSD